MKTQYFLLLLNMNLLFYSLAKSKWGFPCVADTEESTSNVGDQGLIPGSRRSPGEGNNNPLQYSCLEDPMDRGAWQGYSPWGCKELDMTEWLTQNQNSLLKTIMKLLQDNKKDLDFCHTIGHILNDKAMIIRKLRIFSR